MFREAQRLTHARQFQMTQRSGVKRIAHPLQISVLPNDLPHWRLGLSIGRRLGGAVRRNELKRLLRESFRLSQHDLPMRTGADGTAAGYDAVVALRPHDAITLEACRGLLLEAARAAHVEWVRRLGGKEFGTPESGP